MIDPELALRVAVGEALKDMGISDLAEDEIATFLIALKEHGYIVIREINGVHPDTRKE
jgi:hypothetical protein